MTTFPADRTESLARAARFAPNATVRYRARWSQVALLAVLVLLVLLEAVTSAKTFWAVLAIVDVAALYLNTPVTGGRR